MKVNPWHDLPQQPPYVLPDDEPFVSSFNSLAGPDHFLHINILLPEAFVGATDAPVVLLSNNPGFTDEGAVDKQTPSFIEKLRKNLHREPLDYPFVFLDPEFVGKGRQWWERKLKHLLAQFGHQVVAKSILNIPYFPYPSRKFGHQRLRLPSQEYTFDLVRAAVIRRAVIVLMRQGRRWLDAVPELKGYERLFQVTNSQNPAVSPGNCREFQEVVRAIATASEC